LNWNRYIFTDTKINTDQKQARVNLVEFLIQQG